MPESKIFSDKELLQRLKKDDETAFRLFFEKYWDQLFALVYRRLRDEETTKDIIQNVFVSLWNSRKSVTIDHSLLAYLIKASKNQVFKHRREQKSNLEKHAQYQSESPTALAPDLYLQANELEQSIDAEIEEMPENMRKIFLLSRYGHRSVKEIAQELSLTEQTVKNNISQALSRLRKIADHYSSGSLHPLLLFLILLTHS